MIDYKIPGTKLPKISPESLYSTSSGGADCTYSDSEAYRRGDELLSYGIDSEGRIKAEEPNYKGSNYYLFKESDLMKENTYKSFAITGSVPLLKAMEETLVEVGMKLASEYYTAATYKGATQLCSNRNKPVSREEFLEICALDDVSGFDVNFSLPADWDKVIEFIKEQLEYKEFKIGDWVYVLSAEDGATGAQNRVGVITLGTTGLTSGLSYIYPNSQAKVEIDGRVWTIGKDWSTVKVRKATPEEIAQAQVKTFDMGGFKLTVENNKVFHVGEDITAFVKELVTFYNFSNTFGGYIAEIESIVFKRTGCQHHSTSINQWREVYNALTK